jgi:F420-dependent methylenetetrahydromethanopterin dehydrogenase
VPNRALQPDRGYNTTVQDAKLIVVESRGSRPEAELVRGALEEAGIPAIIQGDTAGGMREHLAWSGAGFKILVRENNAASARGFLTALAKDAAEPDADSETDPSAP